MRCSFQCCGWLFACYLHVVHVKSLKKLWKLRFIIILILFIGQCCTVVQNTHDQIMSDGRSNVSYQIAFCAFHSFLVEVQMNAKRMLAAMYVHTWPEFRPITSSRYYSLSNVLLRGGNSSKYLDEIQATYIRCMRNNNLELIGLRAPLVACNY